MQRGLIVGVILWAAIVLGLNLLTDGGRMILTGPGMRLSLPGAGVVIALAMLVVLRIVCPPGEAMRFGLGVAIPGMILGSATLFAFGWFLARPSMELAVVYAVFILWTTGMILIAIALLGEKIVPGRDASRKDKWTP